MKNYFTRTLLSTFIITTVFISTFFISVNSVSAETASKSLSNCQLINILITLGVIPAQNATAALNSFGCTKPNTNLPSVSSIELIGQQSSYTPGQTIKFSVKGLVSNNTIGGPAMGFNVQSNMSENNDSKNTVIIDGVYQSFNATYNSDTTSWDVVMTAPADDSKSYTIDSAFYCSMPSAGCKDGQIDLSFNFSLNSENTSEVAPVAIIDGSPTLNLSYDSVGKESLLTAIFKVYINATSTDIDVPTYPFSVGLVDAFKNTVTYANSGRTMSTVLSNLQTRTVDGQDYYVIPQGQSAYFDVTYTVKPSELFAGEYFARLYGNYLPVFQKALEIVPSNNASYLATVIGEVSPYTFTSAPISAPTGTYGMEYQLNFDGTKLDPASVTLNLSCPQGVTGKAVNAISKDSSSACNREFPMSAVKDGLYLLDVQFTNETGASQTVGAIVNVNGGVFTDKDAFTLPQTSTPAPKPVTVKMQYSSIYNNISSANQNGPAVVPVGAEILLTWSSTNANSCTASANPAVSTWTGTKSTSGFGSVGKVDVGRTYTLTCTNSLGTSATTKIDVYPNGTTPPKPVVVGPTTNPSPVVTTPVLVANPTLCTFDPTKYADYYADLKAAFGSDAAQLKTHWINFGIKEGRTPCGSQMPSCKFVASTYVNLYPDLVAAKVDGLSHYVTYGINEGRGICAIPVAVVSSPSFFATVLDALFAAFR